MSTCCIDEQNVHGANLQVNQYANSDDGSSSSNEQREKEREKDTLAKVETMVSFGPMMTLFHTSKEKEKHIVHQLQEKLLDEERIQKTDKEMSCVVGFATVMNILQPNVYKVKDMDEEHPPHHQDRHFTQGLPR